MINQVPEAPQGIVDVVLDTDAYNEIDDQFAIAYQLGMIYLTDEQLALLVELCEILAGERLAILQGIIEIYKRPGTR